MTGNYISKAIPQPPWDGLPLPSGLSLKWSNMADTIGEYARLVRKIALPQSQPRMLPDAVYLAYKSISTAAISAGSKRGLLEGWEKQIRKWAAFNEKFAKLEVVYLDLNPPPVFWDYKCMKCRFWQPPNGCVVVGGDISPQGWCAIWLPPDLYKRFTYPKEFLKGDW